MKKCLVFLLLTVLFLGLTACDSLVKRDFSLLTPHIEQQQTDNGAADKDAPTTVTNRTELRGAVLSFIRNWTEQGQILVKSYEGNISEDLQEIVLYATEEDPIGAYAVDYIDAEVSGSNRIAVNIVFRRSAAEVASIITVSGNSTACSKIQQALEGFDAALTLRIRNYQDMDFSAYVRDYCLEHPGTVMALPEVSAEVYPKEGETRILELHFSYPASRDQLRLMQSSVDTILSSASSYIRSGKDNAQKAQLLYRFLTSRFTYSITTEMPVTPAYSLLCQGQAHSLSFAAVFYAECEAADLDCRIVKGSKDGEEYYWNLLRIDGKYYHVDLMRSLSHGETELHLLYSQELLQENYLWDAEEYPEAATMEVNQPDIIAPTPTPVAPPSTENVESSTEGSETNPTESTENGSGEVGRENP